MSQTAREEILSKIKSALKGEAPPRPAPPARDEDLFAASRAKQVASEIIKRCEQNRRQLIARFQDELTRVGGFFYAAESRESVCEYVEKLAVAEGVRSVVAWNAPVIEQCNLALSVESAGAKFIQDRAERGPSEFIRQAITAGIGITAVDYALADTGTLVLLAGEGRARSASLLPPVHVALIKPQQIISGLDDLFPLLGAEGGFANHMSSAITFITGPSRTADIEMTLVVGVHGPQQLHVILLAE